MQISAHPFVFALYISCGVSLLVAFISVQRRNVRGALSLAALMFSTAFWAIAYSMQMQSPDAATNLFWSNLTYMGVCYAPLFWMLFSIQYSLQEKSPPFKTLGWLLIIPSINAIMFWTNPFHHLIWETEHLVLSVDSMFIQDTPRGVYYWVFAAISYIFIMGGTYIFTRRALRATEAYRPQAAATLTAILIVLLANGLSVFIIQVVDLTPIAFAIAGVLLAWSHYRLGLLNITPISSETILEYMGDGVLIVNPQNTINYVNPAFETLAGLSRGTSAGHSTSEVLHHWPDVFLPYEQNVLTEITAQIGANALKLEMQVSLIKQDGKITGYIYVFRNIAERSSLASSITRQRLERETARQAPVFMALSQPDGKILDINSEFTFHTGYTRDEAIGRTLLELGLWDLKTRAVLTRLFREKSQLTDEIIQLTEKGGNILTWKLSVSQNSLEGQAVQIWQARPITTTTQKENDPNG